MRQSYKLHLVCCWILSSFHGGNHDIHAEAFTLQQQQGQKQPPTNHFFRRSRGCSLQLFDKSVGQRNGRIKIEIKPSSRRIPQSSSSSSGATTAITTTTPRSALFSSPSSSNYNNFSTRNQDQSSSITNIFKIRKGRILSSLFLRKFCTMLVAAMIALSTIFGGNPPLGIRPPPAAAASSYHASSCLHRHHHQCRHQRAGADDRYTVSFWTPEMDATSQATTTNHPTTSSTMTSTSTKHGKKHGGRTSHKKQSSKSSSLSKNKRTPKKVYTQVSVGKETCESPLLGQQGKQKQKKVKRQRQQRQPTQAEHIKKAAPSSTSKTAATRRGGYSSASSSALVFGPFAMPMAVFRMTILGIALTVVSILGLMKTGETIRQNMSQEWDSINIIMTDPDAAAKQERKERPINKDDLVVDYQTAFDLDSLLFSSIANKDKNKKKKKEDPIITEYTLLDGDDEEGDKSSNNNSKLDEQWAMFSKRVREEDRERMLKRVMLKRNNDLPLLPSNNNNKWDPQKYTVKNLVNSSRNKLYARAKPTPSLGLRRSSRSYDQEVPATSGGDQMGMEGVMHPQQNLNEEQSPEDIKDAQLVPRKILRVSEALRLAVRDMVRSKRVRQQRPA